MKVWSLGDAVVDLLPQGNMQYQACVGGAPVNVAAGVVRLGQQAGFIGRVGDEPFGHFIQKTLSDIGVDTSAMEFDARHKTSTVVVALHDNGEREFSFLVNPSADQFLSQENLPSMAADILHFCSLALVGETCRQTLDKAIQDIHRAGGLLSFDVNLREQMWPDAALMRRTIQRYVELADILKLSDEELHWLTGTDNQQPAIEFLQQYPARLKVITYGAKGCLILWQDRQFHIKGYQVDSIDTTGAGDAFMAGLLATLAKVGPELNELKLQTIFSRASACGALATTQKGAINAAPTEELLEQFIQQRPALVFRSGV